MRPSKIAAYGLLSRTWLSMQRYDSAFKYANLCLQLKNDLLDYNNTSEISTTSTTPFKPFNTEVIFYTTMSNSFSAKAPGTALIDSMLFKSYENNDLRKTIFFRTSGAYRRFKGSYASSPTTLFTGIAVDEIYLVRAECHARLGRVADAMNDINRLLEKRWISGTFVKFNAASQPEAINIIVNERRKELLMRGLRWPDIKRYNAMGANIVPVRLISTDTFKLQPNEKRYALPLPTDIIQLTGMQQN
ncbi:MAG: RagB/SusD family nutrient uptake outer membrane protein [Ferruginibacter sp.]